jgi:hypothetical protein
MTDKKHIENSTEVERRYKNLLQAIIDNGGVECEQVPEIFFPEDLDYRDRKDDEKLAKAICARCPIAVTCLQYALTSKEPWGIYAGLTSEERKQIKMRP